MPETASLRIRIEDRVREGAISAARSFDKIKAAAKGTTAGVDKTTKSMNVANKSMMSLRSVAISLGASMGVRELINYADTWTQISNRLKLVTTDATQLATVQRQLFDLARETRSSFESTVDLYSRMARTTKELGLSSSQLLTITRAVNQAFLISGAGAQEAAAAVMQLGQGFAAGRLSGDELNSVLEQAPRLAEAIAEGMGVTVGALKKLGSEGALSTKKVADALLLESGRIGEEFAKLDSTIAQSFTILENAFTRLVGKLNEALGGTDSFGGAILRMADAIDDLGEALAKLNAIEIDKILDKVIQLGAMAAGARGGFALAGWPGAIVGAGASFAGVLASQNSIKAGEGMSAYEMTERFRTGGGGSYTPYPDLRGDFTPGIAPLKRHTLQSESAFGVVDQLGFKPENTFLKEIDLAHEGLGQTSAEFKRMREELKGTIRVQERVSEAFDNGATSADQYQMAMDVANVKLELQSEAMQRTAKARTETAYRVNQLTSAFLGLDPTLDRVLLGVGNMASALASGDAFTIATTGISTVINLLGMSSDEHKRYADSILKVTRNIEASAQAMNRLRGSLTDLTQSELRSKHDAAARVASIAELLGGSGQAAFAFQALNGGVGSNDALRSVRDAFGLSSRVEARSLLGQTAGALPGFNLESTAGINAVRNLERPLSEQITNFGQRNLGTFAGARSQFSRFQSTGEILSGNAGNESAAFREMFNRSFGEILNVNFDNDTFTPIVDLTTREIVELEEILADKRIGAAKSAMNRTSRELSELERVRFHSEVFQAQSTLSSRTRRAGGDVFLQRKALEAFTETVEGIKASQQLAVSRSGSGGTTTTTADGVANVVVNPQVVATTVEASDVVEFNPSAFTDFGIDTAADFFTGDLPKMNKSWHQWVNLTASTFADFKVTNAEQIFTGDLNKMSRKWHQWVEMKPSPFMGGADGFGLSTAEAIFTSDGLDKAERHWHQWVRMLPSKVGEGGFGLSTAEEIFVPDDSIEKAKRGWHKWVTMTPSTFAEFGAGEAENIFTGKPEKWSMPVSDLISLAPMDVGLFDVVNISPPAEGLLLDFAHWQPLGLFNILSAQISLWDAVTIGAPANKILMDFEHWHRIAGIFDIIPAKIPLDHLIEVDGSRFKEAIVAVVEEALGDRQVSPAGHGLTRSGRA